MIQIATLRIIAFSLSVLLASAILAPGTSRAASAQILGWNNLGMHCMDSDYSVFSILPPYNTFHGGGNPIECDRAAGV